MAYQVKIYNRIYGIETNIVIESKDDAKIYICNYFIAYVYGKFHPDLDVQNYKSSRIYLYKEWVKLYNLILANKLDEFIDNLHIPDIDIHLIELKILPFPKDFIEFANKTNKEEIFK